jgi:predicted kinase
MKNPKILILVGTPGSGKSTFARYFVRTEENWVRLCRDDFRSMQFASSFVTSEQEEQISKIIDASIETLLRNKTNVLLDATHTNRRFIEHFITKFNSLADISFKVFDEDLEVLKIRCRDREMETGKHIPEKVIEKFVNELNKLKTDFDFSFRPKTTEIADTTAYRQQNENLPRAIISDIDGTLALLNGRNPYDASTADEDLLHEPVAAVLKLFHQNGYKIILLSGREDIYEAQTKTFLGKHEIPYDALLMRKANDFRKDAVIKKEIFEREISEKYYIELILDDRNQVVDLWRKQLQLPCFQVNYGDF